jgi:hypothetical protein
MPRPVSRNCCRLASNHASIARCGRSESRWSTFLERASVWNQGVPSPNSPRSTTVRRLGMPSGETVATDTRGLGRSWLIARSNGSSHGFGSGVTKETG